jgi:hypothetical protein
MENVHHSVIHEFYQEGQLSSGNSTSFAGFQRFLFPSPSLQWVVTHNQGTIIFMESIKDSNSTPLLASLDIIDGDTFVINLTEATTGFVDVIFPVMGS